MFHIYDNSVLLPIDAALIFEDDRLAIRVEIKEWLSAHITHEWSHDLYDGWSRFTFNDAGDAGAFATEHATSASAVTADAPIPQAPADDFEVDDTPTTNPDVQP